MPELTEPMITAIFGGLLRLGMLLGWPAVTGVRGLMGSERLLGTLYWHLIVGTDTARSRH